MEHNFTKRNPCPICGKPDWCFYKQKGTQTYVYCHRKRPTIGDEINGYVCYKHTDQCGAFQTIEQYKRYSKGTYYTNKSNNSPITFPAIPKASAPKADLETLNKAYSALIQILLLEDIDKNNLLSEGWDLDMIKRNQIVSFPPRDRDRYEKRLRNINPYRVDICDKLIRNGVILKNVPGFGLNAKGKWTFYGPSGMIFPVKDFHGNIIQLRIRPRFTEDDLKWYQEQGKKPPKYMNFTSEGKTYGAKCGGGYGVYLPSQNTSLCFITEGEKKGIVIAEKRNAVAIALQGVSTFKLLLEKDSFGFSAIDYLKERHVKTIAVCFDADKLSNKNVLDSETSAVNLLKNLGFSVAVCDWNPLIAKGIDDLIWKGLNPTISIVK